MSFLSLTVPLFSFSFFSPPAHTHGGVRRSSEVCEFPNCPLRWRTNNSVLEVNFKGVLRFLGTFSGGSQALGVGSISSARYLNFLRLRRRPKGEGLREEGGRGLFWGLGWRVGGSVVLRSVQQLLKLTLFELSIVSDFVKCVRLHNLPVLKDGVQQVLEMNRRRWREGRIKRNGNAEG